MFNQVKKIAIEILPPFLWRLIRRIKRGNYVANAGLDRKLKKYLNYRNGLFVELGANDGIVQSNTYYFEKTKGWKGILIEPSVNKYLECIANRSKNNTFICAGCVSFDFKEEFVKIAYSDFMSAPLNVETDISDPYVHAKKGEQYLGSGESVFVFGALALTLNEILKKSSFPDKIDLLSLDVEGGEIEVLKGINHERYRFRYLLIECRDFEKLNTYLALSGYKFLEKLSHHDYLFTDERSEKKQG